MSKVVEFYTGKNIFITGATGFLGTVVVEKLLRSVPDVGNIYLHMRPKFGKPVSDRLEQIKQSCVFDKFLETKNASEALKKLVPIAGDVRNENLGISDADRKMLIDNVNVVMHVAASIDFSDPLKESIRNNTLGTRKVVELCKEIKNLAVFVHVSSSYVNTWRLDSKEIVYDLNIDAERVIDMAEKLSTEELEKLQPQILGKFKSSYTFSKYLAEYEVLKVQDQFPCTMVRPSIISGTIQEPYPYCPVDVKTNSPQGLLHGILMGVVRRVPGDDKIIMDYIPIDICANNIIVAGYHAYATKPKKATIFCTSTGTVNPCRWSKVTPYINEHVHEYSSMEAAWYPYFKMIKQVFLFKIAFFFVQMIPAVFFDTMLVVLRQKPLLINIQLDVLKMVNLCKPFINEEYLFYSDNLVALHKWLNPVDQKMFNLDVSQINWNEYFLGMIGGIRQYVLRESMDNIAAAKRKNTAFKYMNYLVQGITMLLMCYAFSTVVSFVGLSSYFSLLSLPLYYLLFQVVL